MLVKNMIYQDESRLEQFININGLTTAKQLLVQIFSSHSQEMKLKEAAESIKKYLPQSVIVGVTTDGEICEESVSLGEIVVSFGGFNDTHLEAKLIELTEVAHDSSSIGEALGRKLAKKDTQLLLLFGAGTHYNNEELVKGIQNAAPELIIAGGIAGKRGANQTSYLLFDNEMVENGIAAVALQSKSLQVQSYINRNWEKIGKRFPVTKADGRRVYELDHQPAIHIYQKYLGFTSSDAIKAYAPGFPLVKINADGERTLFITEVHSDGSLSFNEPLSSHDTLQFSYGNIAKMLDETRKISKALHADPAEGVFIYSCMARRRFLQEFAQFELSALQINRPVSGYFSYGEFYRGDDGNEVHSQSMTLVGLTENPEEASQDKQLSVLDVPEKHQPLYSLSNFLITVTGELQQLNTSLEESRQQYESLFSRNTEVVYSTDLAGYFTSVNPAFEEALGYSSEEVLNTQALLLIDEDDRTRVSEYFKRTLAGFEQYYEVYVKAKDNREILFQIKNVPIVINGKRIGIYGIGRDITEQRRTEEQLSFLAYHDAATGLPNRYYFNDKLQFFLSNAKQHNTKLALLNVDLDHFKYVNDSLGHEAGDELLLAIVQRLKEVIPTSGFLSRFGGDEFMIIIPEGDDFDGLVEATRQILYQLAEPLFYHDKEFYITASIGVSLYPEDGFDSNRLMRNAAAAVFQAKQQGRNRVEFYDREKNQQMKHRFALEACLRNAVANDEFYLCYQPLIDLRDDHIFGVEALIRWNHPELGRVSPAEFIPLAEETGLIEDIGRWVLHSACKQTKAWHEKGFPKLSVSVNVSGKQFQNKRFIEEVSDALQKSGLQPQYLTLELTESVMLRNTEYTIFVMEQLRKMGVKVSVDDFGTGYSSLSYLKHLPIHMIKIDRSFICKLHENQSDLAIVNAVITMGKGLKVGVLAEGVETREQIEILKKLNCHFAQGYYINKPLRVEELEKEFVEMRMIRK